MKIKLFSDKIGRIICGEYLESDDNITKIKNPVICSLIAMENNASAKISMLPYAFIELFDITKHDDYIVSFNNADISFIESVNGGDTNNLSVNLLSNYKMMFDNIRNYKTTQQVINKPTQQTANNNANIVEVK